MLLKSCQAANKGPKRPKSKMLKCKSTIQRPKNNSTANKAARRPKYLNISLNEVRNQNKHIKVNYN